MDGWTEGGMDGWTGIEREGGGERKRERTEGAKELTINDRERTGCQVCLGG